MTYPIFTPQELFGALLSASSASPQDIDHASQLLWDAQRLRVVPRSSPENAATWFLALDQLSITIRNTWGESEDPELRRLANDFEDDFVSRIHKVYWSTAALVPAAGSRTFESFADYRKVC